MPGTTLPADQSRLLNSLLTRVERLERRTQPVSNVDLRKRGAVGASGWGVYSGATTISATPFFSALPWSYDFGDVLLNLSPPGGDDTEPQTLYDGFWSFNIECDVGLVGGETNNTLFDLRIGAGGADPSLILDATVSNARGTGADTGVWTSFSPALFLPAGKQISLAASTQEAVDMNVGFSAYIFYTAFSTS